MGRKTLLISLEDIEKYGKCVKCNISFSNVGTICRGKLIQQYEQHIASKAHQAVILSIEKVPEEVRDNHNKTLELKLNELTHQIDKLTNLYTTQTQVVNRLVNEVSIYKRNTDQAIHLFKSLKTDLFGRMDYEKHKYIGAVRNDEMIEYVSFGNRLARLEQVLVNPIPIGEKEIPTPIGVNNHKVVNLVDEDYKYEKITPKTMILTEAETPRPIAIPESLSLDVLKGIKKVEIQEVPETRHFIPNNYENNRDESDNDESSRYDSDDDSREDSRNEVRTWTEEDERLKYQNSEQYEIYGDDYESIQCFNELFEEKDNDNEMRISSIASEFENMVDWIEENAIGVKGVNQNEAKRIKVYIGKMYQLMNKYDENYYDIPWTEDINGGKDSIYKRLIEISNTVLSLDNINSGRLLPTRGKK